MCLFVFIFSHAIYSAEYTANCTIVIICKISDRAHAKAKINGLLLTAYELFAPSVFFRYSNCTHIYAVKHGKKNSTPISHFYLFDVSLVFFFIESHG